MSMSSCARSRICNVIVVLLTNHLADCCFKGYTSSKVTLTLEPMWTEAEIGQNITLKCTLSKLAICTWWKNGQLVSDPKFGTFTNSCNCDLTFTMTSKDLGTYQCVAPGSSEREPIFSQTAFVINKSPVSMFVSERDKGKEIVLLCYFRNQTKCVWHNPNQKVISQDPRFGFVDDNKSEFYTNCTRRIESIKETDIGGWKCSKDLPEDQSKLINNTDNKNAKFSTTVTSTPAPENTKQNKQLYGILGGAIVATIIVNFILLTVLRKYKCFPFNDKSYDVNDEKRAQSAMFYDNTATGDNEMTSKVTSMIPMYEMLNESPTSSPTPPNRTRPISFEIIYTKIDIPVSRRNSDGCLKKPSIESTEYAQINIKQKRMTKYSKYEPT